MPYFKNEKGAKGYVNDEEMMTRLEKAGYVRLEGRELFLRIVIEAVKDWGIPGLVAITVFHLTDSDIVFSLVSFWAMQQMLS